MKKMIVIALVIIAAIVIVRAFFMPWAKINVSVTRVSGELARSASGPLKNSPFAGKFITGLENVTSAIGGLGDVKAKKVVSGYDIPTMVNNKSSKVAISVAQIIFKDAKDLDKKSKLVYLLPVFAAVCVILSILAAKYMAATVLMLIISGGISLGGLYNLMNVDISNLMVQVTIEKGFWFTMYAYLFIFIISLASIVMDLIMKKAK